MAFSRVNALCQRTVSEPRWLASPTISACSMVEVRVDYLHEHRTRS
jgi:hypothetical protein